MTTPQSLNLDKTFDPQCMIRCQVHKQSLMGFRKITPIQNLLTEEVCQQPITAVVKVITINKRITRLMYHCKYLKVLFNFTLIVRFCLILNELIYGFCKEC